MQQARRWAYGCASTAPLCYAVTAPRRTARGPRARWVNQTIYLAGNIASSQDRHISSRVPAVGLVRAASRAVRHPHTGRYAGCCPCAKPTGFRTTGRSAPATEDGCLSDCSVKFVVSSSMLARLLLTRHAVLGSLIERGDDHRRLWSELGVAAPVKSCWVGQADLYPDALDCLRAAQHLGSSSGLPAISWLGLLPSFVRPGARRTSSHHPRSGMSKSLQMNSSCAS